MRTILAVWVAAAVLARPGVAGAAAQAPELTQQQRDMVADAMASELVLPETATYRFDPPKPYLGGATLICGAVNYQTAARHLSGFHNFYAIVSDGKVTLAQIYQPDEDSSGKLHYKIKLLCGRD